LRVLWKSREVHITSNRVSLLFIAAILISTVNFLPSLSITGVNYAQGTETVGLSNSGPADPNDQTIQVSITSPFISTDSSTCPLDKTSTYLQIECVGAFPMLIPSFGTVSNPLKANFSENNSSSAEENLEDLATNETIFDTGLEVGNESAFDNSTFSLTDADGSSSSFDWDFSSDGGSASEFSFDSSASNNAPKANSETVTLDENTTKAFTLSASDKDGDVLVFTNLSSPKHGSLEDTGPPDLSYKPNSGFAGTDEIQFRVYDGVEYSKKATVNLIVNKTPLPIIPQNNTALGGEANQNPVSDAGSEQTVNENQIVHLDGSKSNDPDSDKLSYVWKQIDGGIKINIDDSDTVTSSFEAPVVNKESNIKIELSVDDAKGGKSSDTVTITIKKLNQEPKSDAGPDQEAGSGVEVKLDGSKSSDPDEDKLSFTWTQKDGPDAKLSDKEDVSPSFMSPNIDKVTEMTFELTVEDTNGTKSLDDVKITVTPPAANEDQADANKDTDNDANTKTTGDNKDSSNTKETAASPNDSNNNNGDSSDKGSKDINDNNGDGNGSKEEDSGSKQEDSDNKSDSGSDGSEE
jgi:hypothetical protein